MNWLLLKNKPFLIIITLINFCFSSAVAQAINRPNTDKPTEVHIRVVIVDIDEINDADQTFTANVYYGLKWTDKRLAHSNGESINVPIANIWHPVIKILNQQKVWTSFPETVSISNKGEVLYIQRVWGQFSQPLNLRKFPLDSQEFTITFSTINQRSDEVVLKVDSMSSVTRTPSIADWKIISESIDDIPVQVTNTMETLVTLNIRFVAKRYFGFHMMSTIFPLVLIVMMSWTIFWLPPSELGGRVGISITSMLTVMAYRFMISSKLPTISYLTRMDHFIFFSTMFIFMTLVISILSYNLHKDEAENPEIIDFYCKRAFPFVFVSVSFLIFFI